MIYTDESFSFFHQTTVNVLSNNFFEVDLIIIISHRIYLKELFEAPEQWFESTNKQKKNADFQKHRPVWFIYHHLTGVLQIWGCRGNG